METKEIFKTIFNGNLWCGRESRSGTGSDLVETENIIAELPKVFTELNIKSMLDIPCGDLNWMRYLTLNDIDYIGADIVPDAIVKAKENSKDLHAKSIQFYELNLITDSGNKKLGVWKLND